MCDAACWEALGLGPWWQRHQRFAVELKEFILQYELKGRITLEAFQRFCKAVVAHTFGAESVETCYQRMESNTDSILLLGQHHAMMADSKHSDREKINYAKTLLFRMEEEETALYESIQAIRGRRSPSPK